MPSTKHRPTRPNSCTLCSSTNTGEGGTPLLSAPEPSQSHFRSKSILLNQFHIPIIPQFPTSLFSTDYTLRREGGIPPPQVNSMHIHCSRLLLSFPNIAKLARERADASFHPSADSEFRRLPSLPAHDPRAECSGATRRANALSRCQGSGAGSCAAKSFAREE